MAAPASARPTSTASGRPTTWSRSSALPLASCATPPSWAARWPCRAACPSPRPPRPRQHAGEGAAAHRRPLRPRQRPLRLLPRRAHALFLRLLPAPRHQPRGGAAGEARAHLPRAAARARHPPARDRQRLGRAGDPRRPRARLPGDHDDDLPRAARAGDASGSRRPGSPTASRSCSEDYRDLRGSYDKLVSVEMIEAVGWRHFDEFFRRCDELLTPGGLMLLQAITIDDRLYEGEKGARSFANTHVFPGGCLPSRGPDLGSRRSRSPTCDRSGPTDITAHYPPTLAAWRRRFLDAWEQLASGRLRRALPPPLDFYLCSSEAGFRERRIGDVQAFFKARPGHRQRHAAHLRQGDGEPLLLLHGLGGSKEIWDPVMVPGHRARGDCRSICRGSGAPPLCPQARAERRQSRGGGLELLRGAGARASPRRRQLVGRLGGTGDGTRRLGRLGHRDLARRALAPSARPAPIRLAPLGAPPAPAVSVALRTRRGGSDARHLRGEAGADSRRHWAANWCWVGSTRRATRGRTGRCAATSSIRLGTPRYRSPLAWGDHDRVIGPPRPERRPPGAPFLVLPDVGHTPTWDDPELVAGVLLEGSALSTRA